MKTTVKEKISTAIGMISGGLDSALATRIIKDLGIEVYGIHFVLPWGCSDEPRAVQIADQLNVPLRIVQLDEKFLAILKNPRHGTGAAMNPCVDCRIYNLSQAKQYMLEIGADFIFTGEILGQRPMSQLRQSLGLVERRSGLQGRLLRPLCAKLLDPTIPEQEGKIDREKLFSFSGRSRSDLRKLAKHYGITNYIPTGGGCLLTDKNFTKRLKDSFQYGYRDLQEIIALKWGRHFRLSPNHKIIVGRDDAENQKIIKNAHLDDLVFVLSNDRPGPVAVLKGRDPSSETINIAASLVKRFSKFQNDDIAVSYWPVQDPSCDKTIQPLAVKEIDLLSLKI